MNKISLKIMALAFLVSIVIAAPVLASEEIQLAAAIGAGSTGTTTSGKGAIGSGKKDTAPEDPPKTVEKGMSTTKMVTIGVIGAGVVAAIAGGGSSSTSSH